jgi:hypothetical protein
MAIIKVEIRDFPMELDTSTNIWSSPENNEHIFVKVAASLYNSTDEPEGSDPYPALTRVRRVIDAMGGTITDEGESSPFLSNVKY